MEEVWERNKGLIWLAQRTPCANGRLWKSRPVLLNDPLLSSLRVSKGDNQSLVLQRRALAQAGVERVFEETASGGRSERRVGAFAEFERALIRERTRAGLEATRKEGRIGGRRPKLRADQRQDMAENILSGRRNGSPLWRVTGNSISNHQ